MGSCAQEIQSVLSQAGVRNITSVVSDGECWRVERDSGVSPGFHVRTGIPRDKESSLWTVLGQLQRLWQPFLAPVVGSFELRSGAVAVVSMSDFGRNLSEVMNWGRELTVGECVTTVYGIVRAAAALCGSVGAVGQIRATRCHVLGSGHVRLLDPAAGVIEASAEAYWRGHGQQLATEPCQRADQPGRDIAELARELGHAQVAGLVNEHAPGGLGAVARALQQAHPMTPLTITHVPRLPGPPAARRRLAVQAMPAPTSQAKPHAEERW